MVFFCVRRPAGEGRDAGEKAGTEKGGLAGPDGFGRGGMRVREKGARRVSGRDARGRDAVFQGIRSQIHADRLPVLCRAADNEGAGRRGRILFRRAELSALRAFLGRGKTVRRGRGGSAVFCLSAWTERLPPGTQRGRERAETRGGRGQEPSFCRAGKIFDRAPDVFFPRRRSFFSCPGPVVRAFWRFVIYFLRCVLQAAPVGGRTDASFLCRFCPIFVAAGRDEAGKKRGARFFGPSAPRAKQKRRSFFIVH